jgi:stalled ribosome alternative rescue factor ArfA
VFAFGVAASGDVPQIVLQMPNAAAQLVIDPLFRRGVLFFRGGVREDVLRDLFSSKDFFRKQVKAERTEKGKPWDCKQEQETE